MIVGEQRYAAAMLTQPAGDGRYEAATKDENELANLKRRRNDHE